MLPTTREADQEPIKDILRHRLAALQQVALHRQAILQRRGKPLPIQPAQLINQLREERDEQINHLCQSGDL